MKLLIISLCTQGIGVMKEHFIYYSRRFAKKTDLYCITNDNVSNEDLGAIETLNISYTHNDPLGYFDLSKISKMKNFIDRVNPDVIFVLTHHTSSILLAPVLKNKNVVYEVHDPNPHLGSSILEKIIIKTQLKQYAKFSKKLIVSAESVKNDTLKEVKYNKDNIEVIPLAVLDNYINDNIEESTEDIDLLYYGKIKKYKGLDTFIEALYILAAKNIKPKVKIVGGTDVLKVFPNIKNIPRNTKIEGYAEDNLLISYIKKAKALILPYHEASGTMAIGQSFYYGTPVIATDVGCFPEYIEDGGIICKHSNPQDLADKIEKFLNDKNLQEKFSTNARKIYEKKFKIEDIIEKHIDLFNKII